MVIESRTMRDTTFATPRCGKNIHFFVSGQTCGQTEELMIFRHSGEPKKSVFSRVFGSSRKFYAERGDGDPNQALYQAEPHPDMQFSATLRALPVVTKPLSALSPKACQSASHCHSFLLPSSATGGGRKRPQAEPHPDHFSYPNIIS